MARVERANLMLRRCQIEVKYAEADAASVMVGAGCVWTKTRVFLRGRGRPLMSVFDAEMD